MNKLYYYLHSNGELIAKNSIVIDADPDYFDSPYVEAFWVIDLDNKESIIDFIIDAATYNTDNLKDVMRRII